MSNNKAGNKTDKNALPEREWSHRIRAEDITFEPRTLSLSPNEEQKHAIARRLDLVSLESLTAEITARRVDGGYIVVVEGSFKAVVTQECVVSFKPTSRNVEGELDAYYTNPEDAVPFTAAKNKLKQKQEPGESPILEEWDDPEHMEGGTIDLGDLVVQFLSLNLEDFPHAEGVEHEEGDEPEMLRQPSDIRKNPFAALQYWKDEDGNPE